MNQTNTQSRGPFTALLDLFSSIWLGVFLMVAIFLYASIGSAVQPFNPWNLPSPRELFEKSEMEWFCWWPFNLMIALFSLNLIVVTLRRIPLKVTTLGVWMIHTGIIILAAGSVYYFARKIEGDAPVYRRRVTIAIPGQDPAKLIVRPGNQVDVPAGDGVYRFAVGDIRPDWPVPGSAEERAYRVALHVETPQRNFTRTLVAGHPELTADTSNPTQSIQIRVPGAPKSTVMNVALHKRAVAIGDTGRYEFHINEINPSWPLMTGEDRGKVTTSIMVSVQTPKEMFTRQLLLGYPQYTEDIIPGSGRAVKIIGRKLIDEKLQLSLHENTPTADTGTSPIATTLEYEPQTHAFQVETAALYLRKNGAPDWHMRTIDDLPHFRDYIVSNDHVWSAGAKVNERQLDLPLSSTDAGDPLDDYTVVVDGYLRYAHLLHGWVDGGDQLYPVAGVRLDNNGSVQDYELAALDERKRVSEDGRMILLWTESSETRQEIDDASWGSVEFKVPQSNVSFTAPARIAETFAEIEGTDWAYRIIRRHDRAGNSMLSVVIVEVRTPEGTITRWAANDPSKSKDVSGISAEGRHQFKAPDPRFDILYTPSPLPPITLVMGPDIDPYVVNIAGVGNPVSTPIKINERIPLGTSAGLTLSHVYMNAFPQLRPGVVPMHKRRREAGKNFSWVHVVVSKGDWQHTLWVPFNNYALPNEQYAVPEKISYDPRFIKLPDGTELELMFSRKRIPLPTAVALDDFQLVTHQGGLIGQNSNVRDYISMLRFKESDGRWSDLTRMSLNAPASRDGYWYFQSIWDAPTASTAGMNFTGCGVGTRDGVYVQLLGTCIAIIGMIYAFYVKPIILRRRRLAVYAGLEAGESGAQQAAQSLEDRMGAPVGIGANGDQEHSS